MPAPGVSAWGSFSQVHGCPSIALTSGSVLPEPTRAVLGAMGTGFARWFGEHNIFPARAWAAGERGLADACGYRGSVRAGMRRVGDARTTTRILPALVVLWPMCGHVALSSAVSRVMSQVSGLRRQ